MIAGAAAELCRHRHHLLARLQFRGRARAARRRARIRARPIVYAAYQILAKPLIDRMGAGLFTSIAMSGAGPAVIVHFLLTHPVIGARRAAGGAAADAGHRHGLDRAAGLLHLGSHRADRPGTDGGDRQRLAGGDDHARGEHSGRSVHALARRRHGAGAARAWLFSRKARPRRRRWRWSLRLGD